MILRRRHMLFAGLVLATLGPAPAHATGTTAPETAPIVTVTPSTGLVDEQVVAVHGEGFAGTPRWLGVVECPAGDPGDGCRYSGSDLDGPSVGADGSFDTTYRVDARYVADDGTTVDCRVAPGCVVRVTTAHDEVDVPIAFDPSAPLAPPPVLTVTPSTDLLDGARVHVELTGFRPHAYIYPFLCPSSARSSRCAFGDELLEPVPADDAGAMSADLILRAINTSGRGGTFDCRVEDCHLLVTEDQSLNNNVAARVAFDPGAPLAPEPTITVTPSSDLVDGQTVAVEVEHLLPGERFAVVQCLVPTRARPYYECEPSGWSEHVAADDGRFAIQMTVRVGFADEFSEESFDCRIVRCAIGVSRIIDDRVLVPRVVLSFAPLPASPAEPTAVAPRFTG